MKAMKVLVVTLCCLVGITAFAGPTTQQLGTLHRSISGDLIYVGKKYPEAQSTIFSVLDRVGKLYSFSKIAITRKKQYKKQAQNEIAHAEKLKEEFEQARSVAGKMKDSLLSSRKKAKTLVQENEVLEQERAEFELEKQKLIEERDTLLHEKEELLKEKEKAKKKAKNAIAVREKQAAASEQPAKKTIALNEFQSLPQDLPDNL